MEKYQIVALLLALIALCWAVASYIMVRKLMRQRRKDARLLAGLIKLRDSGFEKEPFCHATIDFTGVKEKVLQAFLDDCEKNRLVAIWLKNHDTGAVSIIVQ